jgi:formylglycine-generating enzyme required for sulfatase activity
MAGFVWRDCLHCPEMAVVPAGSFMMGVSDAEESRFSSFLPQVFQRVASPVREVMVEKFSVSRYEIRIREYEPFSAGRPIDDGRCNVWESSRLEPRSNRNWRNPGYKQTDDHPVVCVSWREADEYVKWLRSSTGRNYRLLSEAEWEYVARAGSTTAWSWGDQQEDACSHANLPGPSLLRQVASTAGWEVVGCEDGYPFTAPAGAFLPNSFGVYDMHGNVAEWVADCWRGDYKGRGTESVPVSTGDCSKRIIRGGSWYWRPAVARSGQRAYSEVGGRSSSIGFRVAVSH